MAKKSAVTAAIVLPLLCHSAGALERTRLGPLEVHESALGIGLEYERGDYESPEDVQVWRIPLEYAWRRGDVSLSAYVPLLYATSDGEITVSTETTRGRGRRSSAPSSTNAGSSESATAIGDIRLAGSWHLPVDYRRELAGRLTGIVKLGTAPSSQGLGTGENDFALEGGAVKQIDEYALSATLGYEINGDSDSIDNEDVFYGSLAAAKFLAAGRRIGASLYASEALTEGSDEPLEITGFYRRPLDNARDLDLYITRGLSDASPDILLGVQVRFHF